MNEPIGQHVVPRCYLQNFSVEKRKDAVFVDVLLNKSKDQKIHRQDIKNICKIREFYTFDHLPENEKRWLEKYYSRHIESLYHDIYKTLVDPKAEIISEELKMKILAYIIAQELRTPKLGDAITSITTRTIEYAFLANQQLGVERKIYSEDGALLLNLEGKTLGDAIKEDKKSNRQIANAEAVKRLKQIADLKSSYHIMVTKYAGKSGLISSDRPVHTDSSLYSPSCKLTFPIDRNHVVSLYPYDAEIDLDPLKILRLDYDGQMADMFVLTYNMLQVENADMFLYGQKDDITYAYSRYQGLKEKDKSQKA
ncbi:MAG TPA: DUF4238 domain-containing protein [Daejeonella sp.]